ncbi:MAG: matrixin family metalloprotease [Cyanobacteria bacterium P01_A01_bin.17]
MTMQRVSNIRQRCQAIADTCKSTLSKHLQKALIFFVQLRSLEVFRFKTGSSQLIQSALKLKSIDLRHVSKLGDSSSFVVHGNEWDVTELTYGFQELTNDLTPQQIRAAFEEAFGLWSQVTPLRFREVTANPDIVIRFVVGNYGNGFSFDGPGGTLARAFFPPPNGGTLAGDMQFDDAETWSVALPPPSGTRDLVTVAAHEIGHALGLRHSSVPGALMNATYGGPQRFLSQDDIAGIQSIYGSREATLDTATSRRRNRYDVYGLDDVGNLRHLFWVKDRWQRANLGNGFSGTSFRGPLTAISWGKSRQDVFGLGPNGKVLQAWWDGKRWHWSNLGNRFRGTQFLGSMAGTSQRRNRYDIFGFNARGEMLQLWWNGRGWHWSNLGNGWGIRDLLMNEIAAVSWGKERIDVFVLQRNGNVLQLWWDGDRWHWSHLGNGFAGNRFVGSLTAASWSKNRLDVFGLSASGEVLQLWWNGRHWTWSNLGNHFAGDRFVGPLAASSWGKNRLDVFGRGESGNVLQLWFDGRRWNWSNLGPMT